MGRVWVSARRLTRSPVLPVRQDVVLRVSRSMGNGEEGDLVSG